VTDTKRAAALYSAMGFRLLRMAGKAAPLGSNFGAANPTYSDHPDSFHPHEMVSILCGPCPGLGADWLLCVDLDGEDDAAADVLALLGPLPPTLESHRRRHMYFRVPPSAKRDRVRQWNDVFRTKGICNAAVDLKWAGGYALERWDWDTSLSIETIATLPETALDEILKARASDPEAKYENVCREIDPSTVPSEARLDELARDLSYVWPPDGQGRHDASLALGGMLGRCPWPDKVREDFAARVIELTGSDEKRMKDVLDSISNVDGGGPVKGIPELKKMLKAHLPASDDPADDPGAIVDSVVSAITKAFEPPAPVVLPRPATSAGTPAQNLRDDIANWQIRMAKGKRDEMPCTLHNLTETLLMHPDWKGTFAYDEFADQVQILRSDVPELPPPGRWVKDDYVAMVKWFNFRMMLSPEKRMVIDAAVHVAKQNKFHPVRDYLSSVRGTWDGVDRNLSVYLGATQGEYERTVCAQALRAAVARVMRPGCKVDTMLVLEGPQGIMKSTAIAELCPDAAWFYEAGAAAQLKDKDFLGNLHGKWLCEIPEVDRLIASKDDSALKALLSTRKDTYRPPYGMDAHDFLRQLVFFGTTNRKDYLRDETGNRRYLPLACGVIDIVGIRDHRDQLWAQALHEYESGEQWWLPAHLQLDASAQQADRLETDVWEGLVELWLANRDDVGEPFTTLEALAGLPGATPGADLNQGHKNRMGRTLRALGYELQQLRRDGVRGRFWCKGDVGHLV
jgi:hypothetical protein